MNETVPETAEHAVENIIVVCPHCDEIIIIEKINCAIFRHAIYKSNMQQVPPHLDKNNCDLLVKNDLVYGCCKPFRIVITQDKIYQAIECDYI